MPDRSAYPNLCDHRNDGWMSPIFTAACGESKRGRRIGDSLWISARSNHWGEEMRCQGARNYLGLGFVLLSSLAGMATLDAEAAPIVLVNGTVNMFRDTRGANNVGIGQGDVLQYGANIVGGSLGTTLARSYLPTGFTDPQGLCAPLAVNANFCANATPYVINRTAQPWTLRFERPNEAPVLVAGPALGGTEVAVPFPVNVTISGPGSGRRFRGRYRITSSPTPFESTSTTGA